MKKLVFLLSATVCAVMMLAGCQRSVPVTSVEISPENPRLIPGETVQLQATVLPAEADQTVTWESDNACVTISQTGLVTAVSEGAAVVTAMAGGKRDRTNVTVTPAPFPIKFARTQLDTTIALKEELSYTFRYNCYDPFKVEMELLDNDGMAPQFTNSPGDGRLLLYDYKGRYKSVATCRVKIYDDVSEQIIKITVREKK